MKNMSIIVNFMKKLAINKNYVLTAHKNCHKCQEQQINPSNNYSPLH